MGNSSSVCSDRNAVKNFGDGDNGSAVFPTAYNSHSNSNGNSPQHNPLQQQPLRQQLFKTTIPINEQQLQQQEQQQQQHSCICETADLIVTQLPEQQHQTAAAFNNSNQNHNSPNNKNNNNNNNNINDVTGRQQPLCFCARNIIALRSSQANENHTTTTPTTTTTTTIEYELTNGIAKLTKISTSRNGSVEQPQIDSSATIDAAQTADTQITNNNNLPPLLSSKDIESLQANLQAINALNLQQNTSILLQQRANYSTMSETPQTTDCKRDRIGAPCTGNTDIPNSLSGFERLTNKKYSKSSAFTIAERQQLGIHGLMPIRVLSMEEQICKVLAQMELLDSNYSRYQFLQELSERNERLFYCVLASNVSKMMPLVYTPTVGEACQKFSLSYHHYKGLFITIKDKGHIYNVLQNWPESDVRAICVTDGERILGLGDLGANGMGIPIGKLSLYTALAGIKPHQCLPITLDVGTNTKSILEDPFYIGIRKARVTGVVYDEFLDEFMQAVVRRYGQHCLIQFEDFGNANAFRLLAKYRDHYCTFNDDIQGTASVALAGLLASLKITRKRLQDNKIVFFGAGEASLGIANLCMIALMKEGLSKEEAKKCLFMVDSRGLIVCNRPSGGLTEHKLHFAQNMEPINTLEEVINFVKPSVLIGAAAVGGAFTKEILNAMAEFNETPIIFALSNPTVKAECTAEQAYTYTKGKCIFASGSPFGPVQYGGKTYYPGQGNNSYIFPGVALGVICAGMQRIPEEVFLIAAERLAELVSNDDLSKGSLYPPLRDITCASMNIAKRILEYAFENGLASLHPEPKDKMAFIKSQMYSLEYPPSFPDVYGYGKQ